MPGRGEQSERDSSRAAGGFSIVGLAGRRVVERGRGEEFYRDGKGGGGLNRALNVCVCRHLISGTVPEQRMG